MGINESLFFPKVGDYYCESASKVVGKDITFQLARLNEKDALKLQKELASMTDDENAVEMQLKASQELLEKLIIGWEGFPAEYSNENLTICIDEMPIETKLEITMAGVNFARTGILEDKRSKNEDYSPN